MSETTIERGSIDWPHFAPGWASSAVLDEDGQNFTFERRWELPGVFRDMEPLLVVGVTQNFEFDPSATAYVAGEPWLATPDGLWADHRSAEIAATLRAIADALATVTVGGEGEPTE